MSLPLVINPGDVGHLSHHQRMHSLLSGVDANSAFQVTAFQQGTHAARPVPSTSNTGWLYWETDTTSLFYSDGGTWQAQPKATSSNVWTGINNFDTDAYFGSGRPWVDVRNHTFSGGAVGDGTTDDTTAIQAAVTSLVTAGHAGFVVFNGTFAISNQITIAGSGIVLLGLGGSSGLIAKTNNWSNADGNSVMVYSSTQSSVGVQNMIIDMNQSARTLTHPTVGVHWFSCTDSNVFDCLVRNGLGTASTSGVGIAFGGTCIRCIARNDRVENCGISGKASDGIYTGGEQNLVIGCTANSCVDTGFVIEQSNSSGIVGCSTRFCNAGAAITVFTASDGIANFIDGLTIYAWNASVSGGLHIGHQTASAGVLRDTRISNVSMIASGSSGPAINCVTNNATRPQGLALTNISIYGAGTQGMALIADDIVVTASTVNNNGNASGACIQIQGGSNRSFIHGNSLHGGNNGVAIADTSVDATVAGNRIYMDPAVTTWGVYFYGTVTNARASYNIIDGSGGTILGRVGSDAETTPDVINVSINGISFGKAEDVFLHRASAGVLQIDQSFAVGGDLTITNGHKIFSPNAGDSFIIQNAGKKLGFYDAATPQARQAISANWNDASAVGSVTLKGVSQVLCQLVKVLADNGVNILHDGTTNAPGC